MTTVTATTAAAQAGVTIRTWCCRNVIGAVKRSGRWVIDTVSLARRIQIGARRMPKGIDPTATYTVTLPGDAAPPRSPPRSSTAPHGPAEKT